MLPLACSLTQKTMQSKKSPALISTAATAADLLTESDDPDYSARILHSECILRDRSRILMDITTLYIFLR